MSRRDLTRLELEAGDDLFRVVVETPLGSHSKYNYNPALDAFELKDTLPRGTEFPFDFGFFPSTLAEDGDPLDALVLSDRGLAVGIVLQARLIGVIRLETTEGGKTMRNDRFVAIPASSVIHAKIPSLSDLPPILLDQVESFFKLDSAFKGKEVKIVGHGNRAEAEKLLADGAKRLVREERPADASAIRQQQHTGNHDRPAQERAGNEKFGGTRAGKENVEGKKGRRRSG